MALIEINWRPSTRELRSFALIFLAGSGIIGLVLAWKLEALRTAGWHSGWIAPVSLWAAGGVAGVLGLAAPRAVKPLYVLWMGLSYPLGLALSHVALGVVYFVVITGTGAILRILGRDALHRRFKAGAGSYWVRRPGSVDSKRYLRQF
jgi:hypothetical protein